MSNIDRRKFLKALGVGGTASAAVLMNNGLTFAKEWPYGIGSNLQQEGSSEPEAWRKIDDDHRQQVEKFLDNIGKDDIFWTRPIEHTMDGDVKVFELTTENVMWVTEDGNERPAFAYNGMIPGPTIHVTQGDRVRIILHNQLDQSTAIHWHGLDIPNDQDGVTYVNQEPVEPGSSFTYEFTVENSGSHMYHSHHNSLEQVVGGLLGAFIVDPADASNEPEVSQDLVFILNDSFLGFTINGRSFPYTQPLVAKVGDVIRLRFMNEGMMIHPMHLHGMPMKIIAQDGYPLPAPYMCDTLNIAPGQRFDALITARAAGLWAFHCHILSHVEGRQGLFGMTTVFAISED
jgi:FtsP/CotA-like multicopper oxidase with cupredoxin domain